MMIQFKEFSVNNFYEGFNYTFKLNEITALIGNNGSGKSLLLMYVLGIYKNYSGEILIDNVAITDENYQKIRKKIFISKQDPFLQFVGEIVEDELLFTLENSGFNQEEIRNKMSNISLVNNLINKKLADLSGGEAQLVLLESALMSDANIIILDETLSNMSYQKKKDILEILKEKNKTILYITNNLGDLEFADHVIKLENQKLEQFKYIKEETKLNENASANLAIELKNIKVKNQLKKNNIKINEGLNLITGENGSGKTTIYNLLCGFIKYDGEVITKYTKKDIGIVTQYPLEQITRVTVLEEIKSFGVSEEKVIEKLNDLDLDILNKDCIDLSTGELTILLIVINIIKKKKIILLDESLEVIDKERRYEILDLLNEQIKTVAIITHNLQIYNSYEYNLIQVES